MTEWLIPRPQKNHWSLLVWEHLYPTRVPAFSAIQYLESTVYWHLRMCWVVAIAVHTGMVRRLSFAALCCVCLHRYLYSSQIRNYLIILLQPHASCVWQRFGDQRFASRSVNKATLAPHAARGTGGFCLLDYLYSSTLIYVTKHLRSFLGDLCWGYLPSFWFGHFLLREENNTIIKFKA